MKTTATVTIVSAPDCTVEEVTLEIAVRWLDRPPVWSFRLPPLSMQPNLYPAGQRDRRAPPLTGQNR